MNTNETKIQKTNKKQYAYQGIFFLFLTGTDLRKKKNINLYTYISNTYVHTMVLDNNMIYK